MQSYLPRLVYWLVMVLLPVEVLHQPKPLLPTRPPSTSFTEAVP